MKDIEHIVRLLKQHMGEDIHNISNPELQLLIEKYPVISEILKEVRDEESLRESLSGYLLYSEKELNQFEDRLMADIVVEQHPARSGMLEFSSAKKVWIRSLTIAASCAILFFVGYWIRSRDHASTATKQSRYEVFQPGSNRATLTFSDGKTIALLENKSGIKVQDNIAYEDGSIVFPKDLVKSEVQFMQLTTPRGGQYVVELSDGTKVWLNAESSLQYPVRFSGNLREVILTGEAYFEVAHNRQKPFVVTTERERVEVLGTHFNVHSYRDGDFSAVTLSEGKVKVAPVKNPSNVDILTPNKQAVVRGGYVETLSVDVEEYIAWKNGEFMFNSESLVSVLKKLSRWYDFEYSVDPSLQDIKIWGSVSKYETFDKVLKIIKITDKKIKLNIEGRKVIIMKEH